jgi:hypothetical protein
MADEIRVRLTPEGTQDVIDAMRRVQREATSASKMAGDSVSSVSTALGELKRLLPAIGFVAVAMGIEALVTSTVEFEAGMGRAAQRVGTTAESFSTLAYAASLVHMESGEVEKSMARMDKNIGGLSEGTSSAADAFRRLRLNADSFTGKDAAQAFELISQRISGLPDGIDKSRIAIEIFGRGGIKMIPMMKELAEKGFGGLSSEAAAFGALITGKVSADAEAFEQDLTKLGTAAKGAGRSIVEWFMPAMTEIADAMVSARKEGAGFWTTMWTGWQKMVNVSIFGTEITNAKKELDDLEATFNKTKEMLSTGVAKSGSWFIPDIKLNPQALETLKKNLALQEQAVKESKARLDTLMSGGRETTKDTELADTFNAAKKYAELTKGLTDMELNDLSASAIKRNTIRNEELKGVQELTTVKLSFAKNQIAAQASVDSIEQSSLQRRLAMIQDNYRLEIAAAQSRRAAIEELIRQQGLKYEYTKQLEAKADQEYGVKALVAAQGLQQKLTALYSEQVGKYKSATAAIKAIDDELYGNKLAKEKFFDSARQRGFTDQEKLSADVSRADRLEGELRDAVLTSNTEKAKQLYKELIEISKTIAQAQGIKPADAARIGEQYYDRAEDLYGIILAQKRQTEVIAQATASKNIEALGKQMEELDTQVQDLATRNLQNVKVQVVADGPSITNLIDEIKRQLESQKFNINVTPNLTSPGQSIGSFARGDIIPGPVSLSGGDNVLMMGKSGEFIHTVQAHKFWGTDFMRDINAMRVPGYVAGGPVGEQFAGDTVQLELSFNGRKSGSLRGSRDTVRALVSALQEVERGTA